MMNMFNNSDSVDDLEKYFGMASIGKASVGKGNCKTSIGNGKDESKGTAPVDGKAKGKRQGKAKTIGPDSVLKSW